MVGEYRKKPIVVEAVPWLGDNLEEITELVGPGDLSFDDEGRLEVWTLEGWVFCPVGHLIIKGVHGEFYPCDPDVFADSYDSI